MYLKYRLFQINLKMFQIYPIYLKILFNNIYKMDSDISKTEISKKMWNWFYLLKNRSKLQISTNTKYGKIQAETHFSQSYSFTFRNLRLNFFQQNCFCARYGITSKSFLICNSTSSYPPVATQFLLQKLRVARYSLLVLYPHWIVICFLFIRFQFFWCGTLIFTKLKYSLCYSLKM